VLRALGLDHRVMGAVAMSLELRRSARSDVRSGSRYGQNGWLFRITPACLLRDETLGEG
jgi:hypothetical protein